MRLYRYLIEQIEVDESFKKLEDNKIADEFDYSRLTLKKAPKDLQYVIKYLKKHLKTPLKSIMFKNGTAGEGGIHVAVYSESMDSMAINITNIKKLKYGLSPPSNFNDQLKVNKKSLAKWEEYQKKVTSTSDIKKARGIVNKLKINIRNLEDKIRNGDIPVLGVSTSYTKSKEDAIESIILHELGHRVMSKYDTTKFQIFFNKGDFPTEYSKRNIKEYFSEIHSLTKMKLIDNTPISEEAKKYFKKVIK